jgi:hypothetical protein
MQEKSNVEHAGTCRRLWAEQFKKKKKTKKQKRTYTPKYVAKISKEREATKLE